MTAMDLAEVAPAITLPSGQVLLAVTGADAHDLALICSRHATAAINDRDRVTAEQFLLDAYTIAEDAYDGTCSASMALYGTLGQVTEAFNTVWPDGEQAS
jgi:4-aminobutyrate aminotransferase-like enzyme